MQISTKIITNAKKDEIIKLSENNYKIKVSAIPQKGQANKKVIKILSKYFDVNTSAIKIIKGETSNIKIIEVIK